jgi:predicted ATP-dependent serine protease
MAEAARLGFTRVIVPSSAPAPPSGIIALRAATVADALELARTQPQPLSLVGAAR